jgi:hypothetical protein
MHTKVLGVTLLELVISIILMSIVALGIINIEFFSRFQVKSSMRQTKVQTELSVALSHMTKGISKAIGNEVVNNADTVVAIDNNPNSVVLRVYIDASNNGKREAEVSFPPGPTPTQDHWIAYSYGTSGAPVNRYKVRYCGRCRRDNCNQCMDAEEDISSNITSFIPDPSLAKPVNGFGQLNNNFVTIQIQACWDATLAASLDNPCFTMSSRIEMPAVSVN